MISKIIQLKNIGLFSDALPLQPIELDTATIIYGENGRGKSTLASIFHACSLGDEKRIDKVTPIVKTRKMKCLGVLLNIITISG